ncbi:uncharacterized protein LOC119912078 isoform X1 [Micropterus salmoides]|uniref:uncharacterized protein LOC119912078 isoform X1 n=1 Tax=Micropterus salmoides TaxID=27706 RepID=UPI0018EE1A46|nr:uncharacterized protein LOC119912078 isoform X1 [Micropterus salmoides]
MMNFFLTIALIICSISWISVSVSESQTVKVQPGQEVTLSTTNISKHSGMTTWFRVVNRTKASCISVMAASGSNPLYCDGFKNGKFEMSSNTSTVFLKIKTVNLSDSGLYLCGFYIEGQTILSVIHLNVEGSDESHDDVDRKSTSSDESHDDADRKSTKSDRIPNLMSVILGGLTVFLITVIICLVVKNRKLQKAANEKQNPQQRENLDSDDLKALSLYSTTIRNRRPASEREVETHVVYAASR